MIVPFATFCLTELFDAPVPWHWGSRTPTRRPPMGKANYSNYPANFTVGEYSYYVVFDQYSSDPLIWNLSFMPTVGTMHNIRKQPGKHLASSVGVLNIGTSKPVFATLKVIVGEFLKLIRPAELVFSAFVDEPSRIKLYTTFVDNVTQAYPAYAGLRPGTGETESRVSAIFKFVRRVPKIRRRGPAVPSPAAPESTP